MNIINLSETMFPDFENNMLLSLGDWHMVLMEQDIEAYGGHTYKGFVLTIFKLDSKKGEIPNSKSVIQLNHKWLFIKVLRLIQLFDMIEELDEAFEPIKGDYKERLTHAMIAGVSIQSLKAMYNLTLRQLGAKNCEYFEGV